ncbi:DUF3622 domain-containing protein [Shewanella sp. AS16]|uniref:DUF3622 domain-containing protein n=1 Tax=Shewanella sp. AS16 TaxID=2907625 RepID=UPI001F1D6DC8|nr:DUF3622 domain-containing protein [Shewanella sp. AS16]MCE9685583.1 DUF3622 domain-containing protein [Shewanella sp. AS16]
MSKGKKYDFRVTESSKGWKAEIVRRMTSTKTVVSKFRDGMATEAEAQAWGEETLKSFLQAQVERNKQQSEKRTQAAKVAEEKRLAAALAAERNYDEAEDSDEE